MDNIYFTDEDLRRCAVFSEEQDSGHYGNRNQFNAKTKQRQIFIGKLGEVVAWRALRSSEPDFEIYPPRKKNWKPDLQGNGFEFHVKSQEAEDAKKYGLSWTFQLSDAKGKGGKDLEIFKDHDGKSMIVFVGINYAEGYGKILAVIAGRKLFDLKLFRDPKLPHLIGIKKVIYFDDLKKANLVGATDHLSPIKNGKSAHK